MKPRKLNMVQEILSEQCIYGGLLATRAEVYTDLMKITKERGDKPDITFIDRLSWMPPKATPEQAKDLAKRGFTLKNMRARELASAK